MASYELNSGNDSVGNTAGFGFGGMGLIILLLLFFAIFSGDGLFGGRRHDDHGYAHAIPCGPTNCQIDLDVQKGMYENELLTIANADRVIENQNNIDMKNTLIALQDSKAEVIALRTQVASDAKFNALFAEIREVKCGMMKTPPVYADAYLPSKGRVNHQDNDWC